MGGPPSKGTKADQRLKANNPNVGKPKTQPWSSQGPKQPPLQGKKGSAGK